MGGPHPWCSLHSSRVIKIMLSLVKCRLSARCNNVQLLDVHVHPASQGEYYCHFTDEETEAQDLLQVTR